MHKYIKIWTQSVLSAMLAVGAAQAQSPTTPAVPAGPISVVPNGPAPATAVPPVTVTPEMRTAIKELLEVTKFRENLRLGYQGFSQVIPQQMAQAVGAALQQNQQLTNEQKKQVAENLKSSFDVAAKEAVAVIQDLKLIDQTVENVYPIYAKYFTLAEIKQLIAIYKTPIGTKMLSTMPQVAADSVRSGMTIAQPRVTAILNNLMKKEIEAVQKNSPAK